MNNAPRPRVAVLDDWMGCARSSADWSGLEQRAEVVFFSEPLGAPDKAAPILADFDILLPMRERMPLRSDLLSHLPHLKLLALTGFHAPHVDLAWCRENGVTVCGSGIYTPTATAELTFALIMAAQRDLVAADSTMRAGKFQAGLRPAENLEGATLGIVGLGKIGARVANYGRAFGMNVVAWSPNLTPARAAEAEAQCVLLPELLAQADVVSLHLMLSPLTAGIIGAEQISAMKPGALLVNTARAGLIDTNALVEALESRRIRAAIDVYDKEPLPADHPILRTAGTVLAPHLGFSSRVGMEVFYRQSVENILAFLDGCPIRELPKP